MIPPSRLTKRGALAATRCTVETAEEACVYRILPHSSFLILVLLIEKLAQLIRTLSRAHSTLSNHENWDFLRRVTRAIPWFQFSLKYQGLRRNG